MIPPHTRCFVVPFPPGSLLPSSVLWDDPTACPTSTTSLVSPRCRLSALAESGRLSQVHDGTPCNTCRCLRPRRKSAASPLAVASCCLRCTKAPRLPRCPPFRKVPNFRGSIHSLSLRPVSSLSTLHVVGYPTPRKTRYCAAGWALRRCFIYHLRRHASWRT